jgi:surface carbohydrate biosynthesis protein
MLSTQRPHLIIPSEIQVREFDSKLLLACLAAGRGYSSIVGSRMAIHNNIVALPHGIYFAKDAAATSCKIFSILDGLGLPIIAWDEEALVYYSTEQFLARRTCSCTLSRTDRYLTWGESQRAALSHQQAFSGIPLEATGNPRADMLRPELRRFYDQEVAELRRRFGRMILINSNSGRLNHFLPHRRLTPSAPGELARRNFRADDLPLEVWQFREKIFHQLRDLIPVLARAFEGHTILVRPHPAEAHQFWIDAAGELPNVKVVHEGSVVPWLLAADVMIHNGCTTAIESHLLGRPTIAFRPVQDTSKELMLPNMLSMGATTQAEVIDRVRQLVAAPGPAPAWQPPPEIVTELDSTITGISGPFACERVLDVVDGMVAAGVRVARRSGAVRLAAYRKGLTRGAFKRLQGYLPFHKNSRPRILHRFPDLDVKAIEAKVARLQASVSRLPRVRVRGLKPNVVEISPA